MTEKKKGISKVGLAAAIVGAVAAGLFLYGKEGKQRRLKLEAWTLRAKADVLEQLQRGKEVSKESYMDAVDRVTAKYGKLKNVGVEEADKLNRELKRHWKAIVDAAAGEEPKKKKSVKHKEEEDTEDEE